MASPYVAVATAAGLMCSTAALSVQPAAPSAENVPAVASIPAKKICRSIVPTGSIRPKRFCYTKSDWGKFNGETQKGAEGFLDRRGAGMCDIQCEQ